MFHCLRVSRHRCTHVFVSIKLPLFAHVFILVKKTFALVWHSKYLNELESYTYNLLPLYLQIILILLCYASLGVIVSSDKKS